jgi:hypothetical protein
MNTKVFGVVIGVVIAIVGILGAIGTVPGLACATSPCGTNSTITASFIATTNNLTVTITDDSQAFIGGNAAPADVSHIYLTWGDGSSTTLARGAVLTHSYPKAGQYPIYEKVWATFSPANAANKNISTFSETIAVKAGGSCTSNCGQVGYTLAASATFVTSNLTVTVTDTSTATNVSRVAVTLSWGDGTTMTTSSLGGVESHTYGSAGTYNLTDSVSGVLSNGTTVQSVAALYVSVSPIQVSTGCGGYGNPVLCAPPVKVLHPYNAVTGFLILFGIGFAVFAVVPGDLRLRIVGTVVMALIGLGSGYFIGGPGPL